MQKKSLKASNSPPIRASPTETGMEQELAVVQNLVDEGPFTNDLILENIFQKCSRATILNCRLVSKKWYSSSLRIWNNGRSPIKISCESKKGRTHPLVGRWAKESREFMFEFVRDFYRIPSGDRRGHISSSSSEINGMSAYKAISLTFDYTFLPSSNPENPLNQFWSRNGAWITSLNLTYFGSLEVDFFRHILRCDHTPALQELELNVSVVPLTEDGMEDLQEGRVAAQLFVEEGIRSSSLPLKSLKISNPIPHLLIDWEFYLRSCSKLEKLDLGECNLMSESNLDKILGIIKEIRAEDPTKLCLKSLRWWSTRSFRDGEFLATVPKLLKDCQLDLESLSFAFAKDVPYKTVQQLCTMHYKSLKKLSFFQRSPLEISPFAGVPRSHLTSLVVEGEGFANLLFLRELPVLRSLKLKGREYFSRSEARNTIISATKEEDMGGGVSLPSLTSFYCDYVGDFEPGQDLPRLAAWMPALLRLELQLGNESFPAVCGLWPKLQHVTVFGGRIGDRGIVGRRLQNGRITFNQPNITNLQDLRSFAVVAELGGGPRVQEGDLKLSCHTVKHGLAKLRRLEQVSIAKIAAPDYLEKEKIEKCMKMEMPLAKINWT